MKLFFFCLTLLSSFCATAQSLPDSLYPKDSLIITYHTEWAKKHYPERIKEFKKNPLKENDIIFLGNSITEQAGDWGKRLGWANVKNRGISGDVTEGVLQRLDEIIYVKPKAVYLLIGINDIFNNSSTPAYVANNILVIMMTIRKKSPDTKLFVQTILPTDNPTIKEKIQDTNDLLKKQAGTGTYILLDTHELFADSFDMMKEAYTTDGVHLNEAGYSVWVNFLKNLLPD